ncbi:MAG TPA: thiamine pyrophosphate-dependent dehydrogenase E1 component subunit alpha [Terriglobales bacterium]|nr:thiamine pyrophosphate-dependent dehydrogenase E1 component subunit alpha [Terriglobales bacterium]
MRTKKASAASDSFLVCVPQFRHSTEPVAPWRLLDPQGHLAEGCISPLSDDAILRALRLMMLSRAFDHQAISFQRQGRFGTFSAVHGQEASVVGSALALDPSRDWIVPQYRELPALLNHGLPLESFILYFKGHPRGGAIPDGVRSLPIQISLAAQLPHAVGLAWGLQLQGIDAVVLTYCGDGASSEGDFHESCNLAGVVKAPVIFFLQNNGWAISTPRAKQSAARTFAERAPGYGFDGVVVDGNDLFAVYAATRAAVDRARSGLGPTLIESQTYRLAAHNTSDDPTRYIDADAHNAHKDFDPIIRVQRYLAARGSWNQRTESDVQKDVSKAIDEAFAKAFAMPPPTPEDLFRNIYVELTQRQIQQLRERASGISQPKMA